MKNIVMEFYFNQNITTGLYLTVIRDENLRELLLLS